MEIEENAIRRLSSESYCRDSDVCCDSGLVVVFLFSPPSDLHAQGCVYGKIGSAVGIQTGSFYGVSTSNKVESVTAPYLWVNSIYVDKDMYNTVEVGWSNRPSDGYKAFSARRFDDVYADRNIFTVSPPSNSHLNLSLVLS